ncbi:MAG TPA: tail fiber protein [Saprospiraceae bacterium]|nr:tail fiber protein [Saprospiraceae bacterium]HNM26974.1 tail fiber protein [Saprospiraceae bacterium]
MATPFLAEIKLFSFNFAPKGWALCNGQLMPINQNQALFSLLGTTYGGDGRVNFGLPDLRGRVPMHVGNGHVQGERAGEEAHTLSVGEMPVHNHIVNAVAPNDSSGNTNLPANALLSNTAPAELYASGPGSLSPVAQTISVAGGSQPHENRQPFLVLNFCVALQGIFPSPT